MDHEQYLNVLNNPHLVQLVRADKPLRCDTCGGMTFKTTEELTLPSTIVNSAACKKE